MPGTDNIKSQLPRSSQGARQQTHILSGGAINAKKKNKVGKTD